MQQPSRSALVNDIDLAFCLLQEGGSSPQPLEVLQSIDAVLSRVVLEAGDDTAHCMEWATTTVPIEAIRVILHSLHENLERTRHTEIPEPLPSILLELLRNVRGIAETLEERREARFSNRIFMGWTLQRQITRHRLDMEELLGNLKQSVEPKLIYNLSLDELVHPATLLDISTTATPHRYRLVECAPLTERGVLRIWEFTYFPSVSYSAISYVWRGNTVRDGFSAPEFSVRGAEDADPIGTEVLHDACAASLLREAPYLWLDRLCIMQTSRDDKNWQISKMYNMYRSCSLCIIIPGGLRRLVSLQEETQWIHRGWTLQEALAPPVVQVLFSWTSGKLHAMPAIDESSHSAEITEIVDGRSAMAPLWLILDSCVAGGIWLYEPHTWNARNRSESVCIFGVAPKETAGSKYQFAPPHVAALALAVSRNFQEEYDRKCYTIWKCALMRTSSRPVDMVFSIMGLFDVSLDVGQFDKNDRIGATIALTREILRRGGRANWLGISFHAPPSPHLSMFPTFPRTAVAGKALLRVEGSRHIEISKLMDNEYPNSEVLGAMPQGTMDADGYFTFESKSMRIFRVPSAEGHSSELLQDKSRLTTKSLVVDKRRFKATNGVEWEAYEDESILQENSTASIWQGQTFAVLLGCFFGYTPSVTLIYDCNNVRGMLVEEHAPGKYHVISYFMLSIKTIDWVVSWAQRSFCVGGPSEPETHTNPEEVIDEVDAIERHIPPPDTSVTFANIQSTHIVSIAVAAKEAKRRESFEESRDSGVK